MRKRHLFVHTTAAVSASSPHGTMGGVRRRSPIRTTTLPWNADEGGRRGGGDICACAHLTRNGPYCALAGSSWVLVASLFACVVRM